MALCPHCKGTGQVPTFAVGSKVRLTDEYEDDSRSRTGVVTKPGQRKIEVLRDGESEATEWSGYWWEALS